MKPIPSAPARSMERAFSVADGLVLIGALAVGFALVRGWGRPNWCSFAVGFFPGQAQSPGRRVVYEVSRGVSWTIPFAMTLTIALLVLRSRSPRPSSRRIARQPGAVACAATTAAIGFRLAEEVYCWLLGYLTRPQSAIHLPSPPFLRYDNVGFHPPAEAWLRRALLDGFPYFVSPSVAVSVAVGWGVLRATGRWRPSPGWIDRSGRWMGVYWIALAVIVAALGELSKFVV